MAFKPRAGEHDETWQRRSRSDRRAPFMTVAREMPRPRTSLRMALLAWALFASCSRTETAPQGEPSGGHWRPLVLASSGAIRLPAPPAKGSDRERGELEELIGFARTRTARDAEVARA